MGSLARPSQQVISPNMACALQTAYIASHAQDCKLSVFQDHLSDLIFLACYATAQHLAPPLGSTCRTAACATWLEISYAIATRHT